MKDRFSFLTGEECAESVVRISDDKMSATLELCRPPEGEHYGLAELKVLLDANGVKYGIDEEVIEKMIEKNIYNRPIIVARGKEAVDGEPGYYKYNFRTETSSAPHILEDGSVDYLNMDLFESVTVGQVVAEYVPGTAGVCGYTVKGEICMAKHGAELLPLRGQGFTVSEDKRKYISILNGRIELVDGRLEISNVFTVTGNLDISVGNVRFDGDVYVMGSMEPGLSIIATGNVVIDGHVGSVTIRASKDVILKNGMQGGGTGYIECGGNVSGRFFESATIKAKGNVNANYFFNCNIESEGKIEVSGSKGVIVGGSAKALLSIQAHGLGNAAEIPTYVSVGITSENVNKYNALNRTLAKIDSEIEILQKNIKMFEEAFARGLKNDKMDQVLYQKIKQAYAIKEKEREQCVENRNDMALIIANMGKAKIIVVGKVCPGVHITIDSENYVVTEPFLNVEFVRQVNEIVPLLKFGN
ncbi:MAG: DUF342 domain-containing protein [Lachnospiraceae bacterium]|nr:DUF342 domain-containing protein [Lachnospiraceae bacterium]